jgi:regulator of protease activity HflC (stomatin/prohibitin superfamily)
MNNGEPDGTAPARRVPTAGFAPLLTAWLAFTLLGLFMIFAMGGTLALAAASMGLWGLGVNLLRWHQDRLRTQKPEGLPRFFLVAQWVRLLGIAVLPGLLWLFFLPGPLAAESATLVQTFGVLWLLLGLAGYYFVFQLKAVDDPGPFVHQAGWLILLTAGSLVAGVGLFAALYLEREAATIAGRILLFFLALLLLETSLRSLFFWFSPRRLRERGPLVCDSLLLRWFLPGSEVRRELLTRFEELTGVRLAEVHALRFLGKSVLPGILIVVFLLWGSTAVTVIPLGHEGVRSLAGKFSSAAAGPGLHFFWPWPLGKIEIIDTGRVRQISVGFATDLLGPVLWNEKHLEGEENFLLGDGDEMLTINLPVLYSIRDPAAFLLGSPDIENALRGLAQRELSRAMTGLPVFELMSEKRAALMDAVHLGVQKECDFLGLGVEILFVGLKDMHPPVQVADAYQAVSAAEDEQEAYVQRALAFRVDQLAGAVEDSFRLRQLAGLSAGQRRLAMEGEVGVLRALALEDAVASASGERAAGLLRFRLWQETLARILPGKEKFLIPPALRNSLIFDYRADGGSTLMP